MPVQPTGTVINFRFTVHGQMIAALRECVKKTAISIAADIERRVDGSIVFRVIQIAQSINIHIHNIAPQIRTFPVAGIELFNKTEIMLIQIVQPNGHMIERWMSCCKMETVSGSGDSQI